MHLISRGHHHHPSRRNLSCLCTYLQSYTFTRHQEYYPKQNEILKRKTRLCFSLWICINGMLWLSKTAQICLYARFNNGDVDIVHCHDNAACELLPEFLNALSSNDSTGAPVICFHINSQVGEMVLNAQAEHRDAPKTTNEEENVATEAIEKLHLRCQEDKSHQTCSTSGLHHYYHKSVQLCCLWNHGPIPEIS